MKNKLKINLVTEIYNIFITIICIVFSIINCKVEINIFLFMYFLFSIALILNLISIILSKKNNIEIPEYVFAIMGCIIYILFNKTLYITSFQCFIISNVITLSNYKIKRLD